jgi:protein-tyrosine phosphatase
MSLKYQPRILMVCLGNICRSPMAEGIFRSKSLAAGLNCFVDSAGTGNWHIGEPPHHLSQKVALKNNIDISEQRARQFRPHDFHEFDRIFFMDKENLKDAKRISGKDWDSSKAALLLDVLQEPGLDEVPDPYFGGFEGYIEVFDLISKACDKIIGEI